MEAARLMVCAASALALSCAAGIPARAQDAQWEPVGECVYLDGIFTAMYGNMALEIPVQVERSGAVYRIHDPWPEFCTGNRLDIDLTDPDFGLVAEQATGYVDVDDGATYIASINSIAQQAGWSRDETLEYFGDRIITLADGVITIPGNAVEFRWEGNGGGWHKSSAPRAGYLLLPGAGVGCKGAGTGAADRYYRPDGTEVSGAAARGLVIRAADGKKHILPAAGR